MRYVIEGFESLTQQQCFDMAAEHVIKNGRPSLNSIGGCTYSGIGCAAAPFLTKEGREVLQGYWDGLADRNVRNVPTHNANLIFKLQLCHDRAADRWQDYGNFMERFLGNMAALANEKGLDASILSKGTSNATE